MANAAVVRAFHRSDAGLPASRAGLDVDQQPKPSPAARGEIRAAARQSRVDTLDAFQLDLRASAPLWHNLPAMLDERRIAIGDEGEITTVTYEPVHHPHGTLVLAHGAGANQRHRFMVAVGTALAARGVRTVTFNFLYTERGRKAPDRPPLLERTWRDVIQSVHRADAGARLMIGGKSMGGRIASQVLAGTLDTDALARVAGLVLLGYPLHPPGKPDQRRTAHLPAIEVPILLVQGTRDAFGTREEVEPVFAGLQTSVAFEWVEGGDHSFNVPKSSGRSAAAVLDAVCDRIAQWAKT